jgi:hypothetical protein
MYLSIGYIIISSNLELWLIAGNYKFIFYPYQLVTPIRQSFPGKPDS